MTSIQRVSPKLMPSASPPDRAGEDDDARGSVKKNEDRPRVTRSKSKDDDAGELASEDQDRAGEGADAGDAGGGFRAQQRGRARAGGKASAAVEGGAEGSDAPAGKSAKSGRKAKGGRDKAGRGRKGEAGKGGGAAVRRAEGRDRNEAVEQVSVLVGQDEGGGDAVEQARQASKKIAGDEEKKNAFTSNPEDNFDPTLDSPQVERLGSIQGAIHMVRLTDHWAENGLDRGAVIDGVADKLLGFTRTDQIKKFVKEMSSAPIKQVYPLEVMLRLLERQPDLLPKVQHGQVLLNRDILAKGERILAGHEFHIRFPPDHKISSFALVGGGEPGYEFYPYRSGVHCMVIDTPGEWSFAIAAEKKGLTTVETFTVTVQDPGPGFDDDDDEDDED